ncbi:MAG: sigma-70 family RNA polymerase sigma factor [Pseudomonadota bacterium]
MSGPADDEELIEGLRLGSPVHFERLVRDNAGWMLGVARRLLRDEALAEDALQDAFAKVFQSVAGFRGEARLKTWLYRIAVNAALMKLRARTRRQEQPIDDFLPEFDQNGCRIEAPWSHLATPEEVLESESQRAFVRAKIDELPDNYRTVLLLRDIEELEMTEIADLLELSPGATKVRLHRARSALKHLLEPALRSETL